MECLYCDEELNCIDYYGLGNPLSSDFKKQGDIYRCESEECEAYWGYFYTKSNSDDLYEGYPC